MRKQLVLHNFDNMMDSLFTIKHDEPLFRWLTPDNGYASDTYNTVKSYVDVREGETQFQFYVPGAKREEITTTLTKDRILECEVTCGEGSRARLKHEKQVIRHKLSDNCDSSVDATTVDLSDGILTVTFKHKGTELNSRRLL